MNNSILTAEPQNICSQGWASACRKVKLLRSIRILSIVGNKISLFTLSITLALHVSSQQPAVQKDAKVFEKQLKDQFASDKAKAQQIAARTGRPLRMVHPNGEITEFTRFSPTGLMLYYRTNNIGAARTISTDKVWPGGSAGTSLTGSGMTGRLGEWDGGGVLLTHQDLVGRVTQVDGASPTATHSTHVAGTMISSGIDANAKGMAYQASLSAYDWTNDVTEMSGAAGNGMLLSNHSYGDICGWYNNPSTGHWEWHGDMSISTTIDYKYGYYNQQAQDWDNVAYLNPYYLICKAAGNDRGASLSGTTWYYQNTSGNWVQGTGTTPSAVGPYDCMEPTACAKNILTVGAVNKINNSNTNNGWTKISDVVMSSFSGWGPTDDGRIKPDVVAAGVNTYSTSDAGNSQYTTMSGTSMATPAVTGSLLLVQQRYHNIYNNFMKSSTLKGLAIHTADEAGNAGPDYTYGWGLLNTTSSVKMITDTLKSTILEKSLTNGATFSQVFVSDGTTPLKFTICWTDAPGTVNTPSLNNSTKMIVNDLDIRLKRNSDGNIFYPYILNPASPSLAATTGDNVRDNVEQIYLAAPVAGGYTITVSHKGTLTGSQVYSLIASGFIGKPAAWFTSSAKSICLGQSVTFTDLSAGNPTSRIWYFPGGTPSTSTITPVTVTYNSGGSFPVSLRVNNVVGSDSLYQPNFVTIGNVNLPFFETFETNSGTLSLWSNSNPDNDTTWNFKTTGGTSPGNRSAYIDLFDYSTFGQRDGLITPPLNMSGYSSVNLSFKHAYARYSSSIVDSLIVYASTDCGSNWQRVSAKAENGTHNFSTTADNTSIFTPTSSSQWCGGTYPNCMNIDLTAWAGMKGVKIKFESFNATGNNIYLDNISVSGTPIKPVANFGVISKTVCTGAPVNFIDSSLNPVTGWSWTFNGAVNTTSSVQNPTGIIYNSPGTFAVKLVVANSTGMDSITKTNYITVIAKPTLPSISGNAIMHYYDTTTYNVGADSGAVYHWFITNGTILSGGNTSGISVAWGLNGTGKVQVIETATTGCMSDTSSLNINITPHTGIDQKTNINNLFNVFPNPANDKITISHHSAGLKNSEIIITDLVGRKLFETTVDTETTEFTISLNGWNAGAYIINVRKGDEISRMKFVK